tara:strand:- start:2806 stop:2988 length:183 start_codon:yes stop_codon:yes gene_type:complete
MVATLVNMNRFGLTSGLIQLNKPRDLFHRLKVMWFTQEGRLPAGIDRFTSGLKATKQVHP